MKAKKLIVALICCTMSIGGMTVARASNSPVGAEALQEAKVSASGTVTDSNGIPVIGASVMEVGTSNGVATDANGNFTLKVSPGAELSISYVGMTPQTVKALSGMNITLQEQDTMLDQVVVVGFATQKKTNLTGSVGIATAKDIEARPVTTATQALQGLVPGLNISANTGELDKDMSLNIRGDGTIGQGSSGSPLILIDGMEGDINTINPQDIESISVLKDAAAASIYGSRAPFGVILVTTKKGHKGKATVNYNNSFRFSSPNHLPKMMDSYAFANFFNQAATNAGQGQHFTNEVMQQMLDFQAQGGGNRGGLDYTDKYGSWQDPWHYAFANSDWFDAMYKTSFSQEHNISFSGGGDKYSIYASLGYLNQNGLLEPADDKLERFNATGKISLDVTSWLKLNYSTRFVRADLERPTQFGGGMYEKLGRQTWPNIPVYDERGYFFNAFAEAPAAMLALGGNREVQTDQLYQQAALVIEPIKNWVTNVEFNYSIDKDEVREVSLPVYNHDQNGEIINTNGTNSLFQSTMTNNYMNWNIYSSYAFDINKDHNFKVLVGFQSEEMRQKYFDAKAYGMQDETLPELDLMINTAGDGSERVPEVGGYRNQWASVGFFGRINYDYRGKYLFEGNLRYDGSSRFRRGNRWQWSPSFSAGWNIAQEDFWADYINTCNTLKLRFSYGELGNMNTTGWYPTYRTMTTNQAYGSWLQNGLKPNTSWVNELVSTMLTWETVRTWNVGLDWGLFNNRLTGSFDYFTRYTKNMVGPAPELPNTLGLAAPSSNNCDLQTRGWELQIAWNDRTSFGLSYGVKFLLSDDKTIIDRYPGNPTGSIWTYLEGHEINEIWGFETVGIAKTNEEMQAHLDAVGGQPRGTEWAAGDIMYADLDGKPGITMGAETIEDHGDLKVIGNSSPRYKFGIDINASYKGFDIRAFFQGVMKRDYFQNSNMFWGAVDNVWWSTGLVEHEDYFRATDIGLPDRIIPANTDAYYPRPLFNSRKNQETQTRYLQNASYIRLKNLQIGYSLPKNIVNKIYLENIRVFVSGENLWTGTGLSKIFDPETLTGGNTDSNANSYIKSGGNAYPLARTWSFGVSITM